MAASANCMSTNQHVDDQPSLPPAISLASSAHHPNRGLSSEEENLALSLMMLASGIRDKHPASLDHATTPSLPLPPQVADVPAGVSQGAPVAKATSQTPASGVVVASRQGPTQVPSLSPVVAIGPNLVLEQVVPPSQATDLVIVPQQAPGLALASTQVRPIVTTNKAPFSKPNKVPTRPIKPCKSLKTVAAMTENQTPQQESQQLLHECPLCLKRFKKSRGLKVAFGLKAGLAGDTLNHVVGDTLDSCLVVRITE
ncbi:hypothetical protein CFC21_069877 [Triticum aestivum]|uniref:Uncharacterized protein n=2 Tax=Triticum aestivum TaxID=4565 RepID=A0A3B6LED9_WHEAT|nr:hypothetical protein CFC21_069877 [Triticum aestivum]